MCIDNVSYDIAQLIMFMVAVNEMADIVFLFNFTTLRNIIVHNVNIMPVTKLGAVE